MKEYTIKEFVEGYEKCKSFDDKKLFVNKNVKLINEYISFLGKVNLCELLVNTTCLDNHGNVRFDSSTRDMLYKLNLINMYTNLNVEFGNNENPLNEQYDMLQKHNLIFHITNIIPIGERKEIEKILEEKLDDFKNNNCSAGVCINKQFDRFANLGMTLLNPVVEELDRKLPEILKNMDKKDIENIIKRFVG